MIGSRLGPYEVTAKLGEGGMGEVYRATDTKLKRDVAIKVLPAAFTEDKERLARFEREAHLLAQLNHRNIASIFGLEESDGVRALVMELVEGPTLAERLAAGPLPLAESLSISLQIAQALEEAHEKGIVHRDLKPQNIKASIEGKVKVLDFGLAKAMDPVAGASSAADLARSPTLLNSPTLTAVQGTQLGVILGTAAYMAPEQARGGALDKRADIWAFGVVLYEMLVGRSLFAGDTVTDTLAGVLKTEIDHAALPAEVPPAIRRLLRRCLERNPKNRLHDIADARIVLEEWLSGRRDEVPAAGGIAAVPPPSSARERVAWAAAVLGLLLGVGGVWLALRGPPAPAPATTRFTVSQEKAGFIDGYPALSPDGRLLAFALAEPNGQSALWVHDFDTGAARRLAGTEGAQDPFWSPDGRFLAFFARAELRKVEAAGGVPLTICAGGGDPRGGSWGAGGDILFTSISAAGLSRVSASGGAPELASELDRTHGEQSHRYPWFLPDGRHYLFTVTGNPAQAGIWWGELGAPERQRIFPDVSRAAFDERGYLVFVRQGTLLAQRFDPERGELSGEPAQIAERVGSDAQRTAKFFFTVSSSGDLALRTGTQQPNQLGWFGRGGSALGILASKGTFSEPALSPDGRRVVVGLTSDDGVGGLWLFESAGQDRGTRLTFGPDAAETPIWSPDGSRVVYSSPRANGYALFAKAASGAGGEELLLEVGTSAWIDDWSRDGRALVFERYSEATGADLWLLPMTGERKPVPYLETATNEAHGTFSPDGHYLAYGSDETGVPQVYVQTVPLSGSKWQISTAGGDQPAWRADGRELYYVSARRELTAVAIRSLDPFVAGEARVLFPLAIPTLAITGNRIFYAATGDGQRFLVNSLVGEESEPGIRVTLNWTPQRLEH